MVICIWYCYGFLCFIWHFFRLCKPKGYAFVKRKKRSVKSWESGFILPYAVDHITFVALLGEKKIRLAKKICHTKAANGNEDPHPLVWNCAFDWVTSPSLSVLKDPVYSPFSIGTLRFYYRTQQKPTWWRKSGDDDKVSFVVFLFYISLQVRVHSPNSCTEMCFSTA